MLQCRDEEHLHSTIYTWYLESNDVIRKLTLGRKMSSYFVPRNKGQKRRQSYYLKKIPRREDPYDDKKDF